jgi:hypothetical protein
MVVLDVFIKIAHQDNVVATALMELDEGNKVSSEVVTRVEIGTFFCDKGRLLLMEGCDACAVGWLAANLVCSEKDVGAAVSTCCSDVRPSAVFIAICECDTASFLDSHCTYSIHFN